LLKSCFYLFCQIPDLSSFWQFHVYKEILIWNLSVCLCWEDSLIVVCMQARAALQGGLRKVNARERFVPSNNNRYGLESRRREQLTNSSDSSRYIILNHVDNHFACKKKKKKVFYKFHKGNTSTSEVLVNTSMHQKLFQDHSKPAMLKKVQE